MAIVYSEAGKGHSAPTLAVDKVAAKVLDAA
jgi:hypothetical protein